MDFASHSTSQYLQPENAHWKTPDSRISEVKPKPPPKKKAAKKPNQNQPVGAAQPLPHSFVEVGELVAEERPRGSRSDHSGAGGWGGGVEGVGLKGSAKKGDHHLVSLVLSQALLLFKHGLVIPVLWNRQPPDLHLLLFLCLDVLVNPVLWNGQPPFFPWKPPEKSFESKMAPSQLPG